MTIYSWFIREKMWFSIVMLCYVSLPEGNIKQRRTSSNANPLARWCPSRGMTRPSKCYWMPAMRRGCCRSATSLSPLVVLVFSHPRTTSSYPQMSRGIFAYIYPRDGLNIYIGKYSIHGAFGHSNYLFPIHGGNMSNIFLLPMGNFLV